jgi:serine/threonine-protein kinase
MGVLVVVTVLAVALAMYFVANWFARPIKLLRESMTEIAQGRFDHRIRDQRKDEYGLLYQAFNAMAQSLHDRSSMPTAADAGVLPVGSGSPGAAASPRT